MPDADSDARRLMGWVRLVPVETLFLTGWLVGFVGVATGHAALSAVLAVAAMGAIVVVSRR